MPNWNRGGEDWGEGVMKGLLGLGEGGVEEARGYSNGSVSNLK